MKVMVIPVVIGALGTVTKRLANGTSRLGNKRTSGDHPNYDSKIGLFAEKKPEDLRRLHISQTPRKTNSYRGRGKNS